MTCTGGTGDATPQCINLCVDAEVLPLPYNIQGGGGYLQPRKRNKARDLQPVILVVENS